MKGYFLDLVRLAHGAGPRLQPRPTVQYEGEWTEAEGEAAIGHVPPRTEPRTSIPLPAPANVEVSVFESSSQTNATSIYPSMTDETTVFQESELRTVREETVREVQSAASLERTEVRESLTELVREARTIRERTDRDTERTTVERVSTSVSREVERAREAARLVSEVRQNALRTETERTVELRTEREAPTVEVHIGRIEVRAPASATPSPASETDKPKGVIDLEEYLRQRSRGAL